MEYHSITLYQVYNANKLDKSVKFGELFEAVD